MSDIAIKVENLSKLYQLGEVGTGTISKDLNRWWARVRGKEDPYAKVGQINDRTKKAESDFVWALKDINFEVKQGEVLGIIGRNGAGKSTLLKILSKITSPTTGKIYTKGRIVSLLEVGTGFHPEMTGRENIYLNGAILGMRKREIDKKFEQIVHFAGIQAYINTPVKRYSSGMYVRLAFSVAAHLESEILIVDEVLAVGDVEFQKKCLGKMGDISKGEGRTVLFVSHNMAAIQNLCSKSMLMNHGTIHSISDPKKNIANYISLNVDSTLNNKLLITTNRSGNGVLKFTGVTLIDESVKIETPEIQCGMSVRIRLHYIMQKSQLKNVLIGVGINNEYDERVSTLSNEMLNQTIDLVDSIDNYVDITIHKIPLTAGRYNLTLFCSISGLISDWIQNAFYFNIIDGDFYGTGRNITEGNGNILLNYNI